MSKFIITAAVSDAVEYEVEAENQEQAKNFIIGYNAKEINRRGISFDIACIEKVREDLCNYV